MLDARGREQGIAGAEGHRLAAEQIAEDARPTVEVIFANFSTRSDGTCCVEPEASGK